jgi:hypothetical protein
MINAVMKVIKKNHNTGCYNPPPLKRNLILRFTRGGEHKKNDEGHIDHGEQMISG